MEFVIPIDEVRALSEASSEKGISHSDVIRGVATLKEAQKGDLSFLSLAKYKSELASTKASVVIVPEGMDIEPVEGQLVLFAERPSLALAKVCEFISRQMWVREPSGVHASSIVHPDAEIDPDSYIGPFCVVESGARIAKGVQLHASCLVGKNATIGEDSWLFGRVTLERDTVLGKRVMIHSGAVIGSDGFGYEQTPTGIMKVPQVGNVEVGDDVEIGANTTIDRGRVGPSRIGNGTKIDNQVQLGHNCQIGNYCILCAQVGLAGSTVLEDFVVMGGRSGAAGHLTIGKGAQLAGCAVAFSDVEGGKKYGGNPALPLNAYHRVVAVTRKLPELAKRLQCVESQLLSGDK